MSLPPITRTIPLYTEDDFVMTESFDRFVYKASIGSYKARDMLVRTVFELGNVVGGQALIDAQLDEFWAALSPAVLRVAPVGAQEILDRCVEGELLPGPMSARDSPFLEASGYDDLWRRKKRVRFVRLVHDAALHAASSWSVERLREIDDDDLTDYNSRDVVAGMLMALFAIAAVVD